MRRAVAIASVILVAGFGWWYGLSWGDEREIRASLASLASEFNADTSDGLGAVARAARLGGHFSQDVVVDLGPGTAPLRGRDMLMGVATRLQPRTAAFRVVLDDVGVEVADGNREADVTLTVSFIQRSLATDEEANAAKEFALRLAKSDGRWRIARATAIDTFR